MNIKNSKNTRLLIISQHYPPDRSGNASRIFDMSSHLQKLGDEVTILAPYPSFPPGSFQRKWSLSEFKMIKGINLINLLSWQPGSENPNFVSRMAYYLSFPLHTVFWIVFNSRKFDVVISSAPPIFTGFGGLISKLFFKKKWCMDVRDLWIDASISLGFLKKGSFFERISRWYEQICYTNADMIGVTTQELGRRILNTYKKVDEKKIKVVSNGVDTEFFYPVEVNKKKQIIYAGNIGHAQDLENVILSMKTIIKKVDLKFLIVGDGDIKTPLEALAKREGLSKNIKFTGLVPRENIPLMFSESMIGIAALKKIPSLEYAVPTKAYEYMACRIPFVGCGNGEIRYLAEKSGGGVIADNSPDAIAETIMDLLNNPQKMSEMGKKGREFVKLYYDRKQIATKLKTYIDTIGDAAE